MNVSPTFSDRLVSLDVFRGLTIAAMVLVNNPGTWASIYWPLEHAEWNGWTPTDLVFPFFLFIVGVSITLAFARRVREGAVQRALYFKVIKRAAIIFGVGFFLNLFPRFDFATVRIPGVLQRIAVCYLFASLIFLTTKVRTQFLIALALLVVYWLLMTRVAAPGFAAGDLSKEGSLASYIDRLVFGAHVWRQAKVYDPEGILSTIPAVATTLFGVLTGHWLRSERTRWDKVVGMFVAGAVCVVIGWAWNPFFPINKALWTSSYVLFCAGMAAVSLATIMWIVDVHQLKRWTKPAVIYGMNPIVAFAGSGVLARLIYSIIKVPYQGQRISLEAAIYNSVFLSWLTPINASLAFALTFVAFWYGVLYVLYRKNIFVKV